MATNTYLETVIVQYAAQIIEHSNIHSTICYALFKKEI